ELPVGVREAIEIDVLRECLADSLGTAVRDAQGIQRILCRSPCIHVESIARHNAGGVYTMHGAEVSGLRRQPLPGDMTRSREPATIFLAINQVFCEEICCPLLDLLRVEVDLDVERRAGPQVSASYMPHFMSQMPDQPRRTPPRARQSDTGSPG